MKTSAYECRIYTFRTRRPAPLATPDGVQATRAKLARTSAGYQTAMADPFAILTDARNTDDIPF
ncbi:hypothetical protein ABZ671_18890 [Micromonospora sp. NPDC006766]|uniref:hypothetical protein n=1 Tax=Micromonospora sp. NPDC006766 TaxID=3154778 RepID=UPI003406471E